MLTVVLFGLLKAVLPLYRTAKATSTPINVAALTCCVATAYGATSQHAVQIHALAKQRLYAGLCCCAGLFLASQTTGEAIKGGRLVAEVVTRLGFKAVPSPEPGLPNPPSMITAVEFGSREGMVAFCKGIQLACPVGSYIRPEPGEHCVSAMHRTGSRTS
eukprot:GHRQ01039392.1.p1 GENE.GHRQ01039392.1~~GHRQ01039392.1.p1  ORF type:complete len:160 (-),score=27.96 GHRQ01039392.1:36-515(-)